MDWIATEHISSSIMHMTMIIGGLHDVARRNYYVPGMKIARIDESMHRRPYIDQPCEAALQNTLWLYGQASPLTLWIG